jgi:hypothetical protein
MPDKNSREDRCVLTDADWLRAEYEGKGRNIRDIAADLGCAYSTVGRALRRLGIQARGLTEGTLRRMEAKRALAEKRCTRCGEVKPRAAFHLSRTEATGMQAWCKACQLLGEREYRGRHPERVRAVSKRTQERLGPGYYRERHQILKRQMVAAYGGKCDCCGETEIEFLSLDHVNGGGHRHRIAVGGARSLLRILRDAGWPKEGYRLLCMNCQFGFRYGRTCPHQLKKEPPG